MEYARRSISNIIDICEKSGIAIYSEETLMIFDKKLKAYLETNFNIYDLYSNLMRLTKETAENVLKAIPKNKALEPNCTKMSALNSIAHDARKEIMKYRMKKINPNTLSESKKETFIERLELSKTISNQQRIKWAKEFPHRDLSINKKKKYYLFQKKKPKCNLKISFDSVSSKRDHEILCSIWNDKMRSQEEDNRFHTCWDEHNVMDKRNQFDLLKHKFKFT